MFQCLSVVPMRSRAFREVFGDYTGPQISYMGVLGGFQKRFMTFQHGFQGVSEGFGGF